MNFKHELILSSSIKSWKLSSTHGTEFDKDYKRYKSNWDSVWKRDNNTCYYCDFKSPKHQEIHHLNDDHDDNSLDNLVTICPLCHQNFHLDTISNTNGGKIIWLPEFTQQELNYLCRAIFIAIEEAEMAEINNTEPPGFTKIAKMLETSLSERSLIVEQHFQSGASDATLFANALISMDESQYNKRIDNIKSFKLLHFKTRFHIQTKYWRNNTFSQIPVETWKNLIKQINQD